ncbi:MAG: hypothetical protein M3Y72_24755 [Acidobacteriota bacterium]|nr:hypothetical protein [Acidobacteriota bacterium]
MRTSNFMAHGTLSVRIRQDDYRPFLLTLYGLGCFAQDSGNRYAPEDAMLPGGFAGEGLKYWWSSVINSTLQLTMGLRWLLCYEESDAPQIHLQKAAPKHWFEAGLVIAVQLCPTRFGKVSWRTEATHDGKFEVVVDCERNSEAEIHVHIHPPDGKALSKTSAGVIRGDAVVLHLKVSHPPGSSHSKPADWRTMRMFARLNIQFSGCVQFPIRSAGQACACRPAVYLCPRSNLLAIWVNLPCRRRS